MKNYDPFPTTAHLPRNNANRWTRAISLWQSMQKWKPALLFSTEAVRSCLADIKAGLINFPKECDTVPSLA